ncbi:MAG: hypothetical protein IGQ88_08135 [Gloeomargaritaceae cyanobacterium C42_A2020_066]|nr:hypothetical protein [Gloeomargaritaceae cyanobacterium C42_A2020_066]
MFGCLIIWFAQAWAIVQYPKIWRRLVQHRWGLSFSRPNIALPLTANEKYAWRKIFDHDPRFVILSDKQAVKDWIASLALDVTIPRTLWCGTNAHEIPETLLEGDVVIKATHGWAMNIFVKDSSYDPARLVNNANSFLKKSHGNIHLEWAYLNIPRRLLVEEVIRPTSGDLIDLKLYAFGSHVEQIVLISKNEQGRAGAIWEKDLDGQFHMLDIKTAISEQIDRRPLPKCIGKALELASKIGADFDHVRVDFLTDGTQLYLGEITIYNLGGYAHHTGNIIDTPLNRSWDIRRSWFLRSPQKGWRKAYAAALRRAIDHQSRQMLHFDGGEASPLSANPMNVNGKWI